MTEQIQLTEGARTVLCQIIRDTGNISKACEAAGISVRDLAKMRKEHILLDEMVQDAFVHAADSLEEEARRRAMDGVEEPVFYQGDVCGSVVKYSDTLLKELLRANKPEKFRERVDLNATGALNVTINGYKQFREKLKLDGDSTNAK